MKSPSRRDLQQPKAWADEIIVEPGAEKRLANILKKTLNTPPVHKPAKPKAK